MAKMNEVVGRKKGKSVWTERKTSLGYERYFRKIWSSGPNLKTSNGSKELGQRIPKVWGREGASGDVLSSDEC